MMQTSYDAKGVWQAIDGRLECQGLVLSSRGRRIFCWLPYSVDIGGIDGRGGLEPVKPSMPIVACRLSVQRVLPPGEESVDFRRMVNMPIFECLHVSVFPAPVPKQSSGGHQIYLPFIGSKEALRLLPPVISGSPRFAEPGSGGKRTGH